MNQDHYRRLNNFYGLITVNYLKVTTKRENDQSPGTTSQHQHRQTQPDMEETSNCVIAH